MNQSRISVKMLAVACASALVAPVMAGNEMQTKWFEQRLKGENPQVPQGKALSASDAAKMKTMLWGSYKDAAIALGWDKDLAENIAMPELPPMEKLKAMKPEDRPKMPELKAYAIPCGGEVMPYLLFSRGGKPADGWPLFFQTHGGGSTDEKLPNPHGWQVNTQDWQAQVGVCMMALPKGLYFVPRMANDNKGRWWMKHNHIAFDQLIRRAILFREVDPNRIYMMGISEGAYGTEAMTPFWADRFAGGCAMAGGAGGGERFYNLRNTAFRNDTGENDTMFGRIKLAHETHDYLENLKKADPQGYDHSLNIQPGRGHGIDYSQGPAWIATKKRVVNPSKICWFNYALDGQRRDNFSWLSLDKTTETDTLIIAEIQKDKGRIDITAKVNPPEVKAEAAVYNTNTPPPVENRVNLTGTTLTVHLNDGMMNLDQPVKVFVNGKECFSGKAERRASNMAEDIAKYGDPERVYPARIALKL